MSPFKQSDGVLRTKYREEKANRIMWDGLKRVAGKICTNSGWMGRGAEAIYGSREPR